MQRLPTFLNKLTQIVTFKAFDYLMCCFSTRKKALRNVVFQFSLLISICIGLLPASHAFAYGTNQCAASRFGENLVCTAGDVSITGIAVAPGTPTQCIGGTTFNADLDVTVNFATPDRWDIGIFLANDGNNPKFLSTSGGAASCTVGILPNSTPFLNLDPNGGADTCGDGNSSISGGTGAGVVRVSNVPVQCTAISGSGGNLYIPFVVSWDNQASPTGADCTSIADPVPNTKSKCNAPDIANPVQVLYGTVDAVVLPQITKTNGINAVNPGDPLTYTVAVTNTTGQPLSNALFRDPAAANINVSSVSCAASGGATCPAITVASMQGSGVTLPNMPINSALNFTINASVANPLSPLSTSFITNTANVTVKGETNSAADTDSIIGAVFSDLSTSTKSVADQNGGDVEFGDELIYTITLDETAGGLASGVQVTDDIPFNVDSFTVLSIPSGASDFSTPNGTGANGSGFLDVRDITVPANGSVSITFSVNVSGPDGGTISNTANIINPGGLGATPSASNLTISGANIPGSGVKQLYLQAPGNSEFSPTIPLALNRVPLSGFSGVGRVGIKRSSTPVRWDLLPPLQSAMSLDSGSSVVLFMTASSSSARNIEITLSYDPGTGPVVLAQQYFTNLSISTGIPTAYNFPMPTPAIPTGGIPAGSTIQLTVNNDLGTTGSFPIYIYPYWSTGTSYVQLNATSIINVDSVSFHSAPYPASAPVTQALGGETVYIRSVVSDPFGSYDITSATLDLSDGNSNPALSAVTMSMVNDSGTATKTFEYTYTVPAFPITGFWTATVTANEGTEGTITDYNLASFEVPVLEPTLTILKSADRSTVNSGQQITYTLLVQNTGLGSATTVELHDNLSPYVDMVLDFDTAAPPVEAFNFDPQTSGLTLGTPVYTYSGANIIRWDLPLTGSFAAGSQFSLQFKVQVK